MLVGEISAALPSGRCILVVLGQPCRGSGLVRELHFFSFLFFCSPFLFPSLLYFNLLEALERIPKTVEYNSFLCTRHEVIECAVLISASTGALLACAQFLQIFRGLYACGNPVPFLCWRVALQRFCREAGVKLRRVNKLFLTGTGAEEHAGLTGLLLSLSDLGSPMLEIFGPSGVDKLVVRKGAVCSCHGTGILFLFLWASRGRAAPSILLVFEQGMKSP